MKELLIYAQAYIRLNIQRVIPILVIGLFGPMSRFSTS